MSNQDMIPNFVSVSALQRDYPGILKQLKKSQMPLLILKNNSLEAVMLSPKVYNMLQEKITEYETKDAIEAIRGYKKEKRNGSLKKMKNTDELFQEFKTPTFMSEKKKIK